MTSTREHSSDDQARPGVATVLNIEGGASVFRTGSGADGTQGGIGLSRPVNPSTPHNPNHKIVPATGLGASPKGPSVAGGGASVIGGPGCRVSVGGVHALVEGAVSADFPPLQHSTLSLLCLATGHIAATYAIRH